MKYMGLLLTSMALFAAVGCDKKNAVPVKSTKPMMYAASVGTRGWHVELWLNGEPVLDSKMHGMVTVSAFIVDGRNKVVIRATPIMTADGAAPRDCDIEVARVAMDWESDIVERLAVLAGAAPTGGGHLMVEAEFEADVWLRRAWQEADKIGSLSDEDRSAILAIVADMATAWEGQDVDALHAIWDEGVRVGMIGGALWLWRLEPLFAYEDYTVTRASEEDIRLMAGDKTVLVLAAEGPLIAIGHSPDAAPSAGESYVDRKIFELRFVRMAGKWRLLWI